jgi:cobalt-zinc-cadmium efflux system outer membrane protein
MRYSFEPALRALLAFMFLLGLAVSSAGFAASSPLTLDDAIARAMTKNPGIGAARFNIDSARARRDMDALPQPLMFETEIENFAGTGTKSGLDSAEATLRLTKVLELGDKRDLRARIGDARIALARLQTDSVSQGLAATVARQFTDVVNRQERLKLAEDALAVATRTRDVVAERVRVGRTSDAEQATASIKAARAQLLAERLQRELEISRVDLAMLWGSRAPNYSHAEGDLFAFPELREFAEFEQRLMQSPELLRITAEANIDQARRRLAEATSKPDISLSGGVRQLAETDDTALVFSISIPFGNADRARAATKEADMLLAKSPLAAEELRLKLLSALNGFYEHLRLSRRQAETLRQDLIPQGEDAVSLYEWGFELGSYTLFELSDAQERLLSLRAEALQAATDYQQTLIRIEQLLGGNLTQGAIQ